MRSPSIATWRLSEGRDGLGLSCCEAGLFFGRTPLLEKSEIGFGVRTEHELNGLFSAAYGLDVSLAGRIPGISAVAKALNDGDMALASIAAVLLRLPDLPNQDARDALETEDWFQKIGSGFDPRKHPHVPAGQPEGGQFAPTGSGDDNGFSAEGTEPESAEAVTEELPAIGQDDLPSLEPPPEIPDEDPGVEKIRNIVAKAAARWLLKAAIGGVVGGPVGDLYTAIEAAKWLYDKYPLIKAYQDPPATLRELQGAVSRPEKGYEIHHIVEQSPAKRDGRDRSLIDSPENLVRIPTLKHWELTGWSARGNPKFGGLSPRDYLRGKSWEERQRVGLEGLRAVGVLEP